MKGVVPTRPVSECHGAAANPAWLEWVQRGREHAHLSWLHRNPLSASIWAFLLWGGGGG